MNFLKGKSTRFLIAKKVEILDLLKKGKSRVRSFESRQALSKLFCVMRKKWTLKTTLTQNTTLRVFPRNELEQIHFPTSEGVSEVSERANE